MKWEQADVQACLDRPYARMILPDAESGRYTAQILEFEGCIAEGATYAEAYENLTDAAAAWIESALARGIHIPTPLASHGFAGAVALRLPKGLHRRAAHYAQREGVSLNQFLVAGTAAHVGAEEAFDRLSRRIDEKLQGFLDRLDEQLQEMLVRTGNRTRTLTMTYRDEATTLGSVQPQQLEAGLTAQLFGMRGLVLDREIGVPAQSAPNQALLIGGEVDDAHS
jgi:predicted RNase H-like HicB family nuclease